MDRIVTVIGGTGFVGRYVVKALAKRDWRIRVVSRFPEAALELKTAGTLGQVALVPGNLRKPETYAKQLEGAEAVINLVGLLYERRAQKFDAVHTKGAQSLAKLAKAAGVKTFIQMSALGVERALDSRYAQTKAEGERAVRAAFPDATILRPSVLFGPEDDFFNRFARLSVFSPVLPLVGGGQTRFQPVYVGDVANAIAAILARPALRGHTYELGGPEVMSMKDVLETILELTGRNRYLMPLPFFAASLLGFGMEFMPFKPMLTRDQVRLLKHDNTVGGGLPGFGELGIRPHSVNDIVPHYLSAYRDTLKLAA